MGSSADFNAAVMFVEVDTRTSQVLSFTCMFGAVSYLATSGSWPIHNRMASALMRRPQQGRQNRSRMMMPRWRITPTRRRFLPPNVCHKSTVLIIIEKRVMNSQETQSVKLQKLKWFSKPETPEYHMPVPDHNLSLQWSH